MYPRCVSLLYALLLLLLTTPMTACVTDTSGQATCQVGTTRLADDGCNQCECTDEGEWSCTEAACQPAQCGEDNAAVCEPIFNGCACRWECGLAADVDPDEDVCAVECGPMPAAPACACVEGQCAPSVVPECAPGQERPADDECNTCTCSEDGHWVCTEDVCPAPACQADDGCSAAFHWCNCDWVCVPPNTPLPACDADVVCEEPDPASAPACECVNGECAPAPACAPGDTLEADNGQSCTCDDSGQWACLCSDSSPDPRCVCQPNGEWECAMSPECMPGERRPADDGCNTCICGEDGTWDCSDRACPEPMCNADEQCQAYYDGCNCRWQCGLEDRAELPVACDVVCDDPGPAPRCACRGGMCDLVAPPACMPGDRMAADNGQSCECVAPGVWQCLCAAPTPEGQCRCSEDGEWRCAEAPECAPGESIEAENGQSCECADGGTWSCLCERPTPGASCTCSDGVWACP